MLLCHDERLLNELSQKREHIQIGAKRLGSFQ